MAPRPQAVGFGFVPSESEHHFLVMIPSQTHESIYISEHVTWVESTSWRELHFALGQDDARMRVIVPRLKWEAIADPVRAEFNRRLQQSSLKTGKWKAGQTPLSRLFGKELVLLAWAIEDADPGLVSVAVKNWLGLAPEERWWLFTMTNAATGHAVAGRNKGWRKAVRYALTENPVSDLQTAWREPKVLHLTADDGRATGRATRLRVKRNHRSSLAYAVGAV
jgi:uncharacterized protein DUF3780